MDPTFLIVIALAFGAMWLMSSRTRKQQRQQVDFRANLAVGQEVMTGSGLFGTIVAIENDVITLESTPGSQTRWLRAAIAKLVEPPVEEDGTDEEDVADEVKDEESYGAATHVVEDDRTIDVPDDLSTLPPARGDDSPEKK